MSDVLTYAKIDGPPDDWWSVCTFDRDTGEFINHVIEVDAEAGWLVRFQTDEAGVFVTRDGQVVTERIEGRFALIRHPMRAKQ